MTHLKRIAVTLAFSLLGIYNAGAQLSNPEARKMKENAQNDMNRGQYGNAILLYNQAIKLEPNDVELRRDLAYAHYLNGTADKGREIINEVLKTDYADEQTFQIAAAIESKLGNNNKAKSVLNNGLKKYPKSALLYFNRGNLLSLEGKSRQAVQNFEDGIKADPNYAANYFALARQYESSNNLWSILYYEIFINLEPSSKKTAEAKSSLYKGYINYFQKESTTQLPSFGTSGNGPSGQSFDKVLTYLINKNVAAITSGINTESLSMLRTRIILDWNLSYAGNYPFSLFSYYDRLLKAGHFEAYNQWLFGANENSTTFATWIKTNTAAYSDFEKWLNNNPLQLNSYDPAPFKQGSR